MESIGHTPKQKRRLGRETTVGIIADLFGQLDRREKGVVIGFLAGAALVVALVSGWGGSFLYSRAERPFTAEDVQQLKTDVSEVRKQADDLNRQTGILQEKIKRLDTLDENLDAVEKSVSALTASVNAQTDAIRDMRGTFDRLFLRLPEPAPRRRATRDDVMP